MMDTDYSKFIEKNSGCFVNGTLKVASSLNYSFRKSNSNILSAYANIID
jgi:hypothetical protein